MNGNSVSKISWLLIENWLRNPRNSLILVDEFNVNLTIVSRVFNHKIYITSIVNFKWIIDYMYFHTKVIIKNQSFADGK